MELYNFLIEAKKQTYANENFKKALSTIKEFHDYEYSNGNMTYHDTYLGGTKFIGEEIIYSKDNIPIWGMYYYGITLNENLIEETIDKALRPALMQVGTYKDIIPVRGPREYINGEYKYRFIVTGDLNYFKGMESIFKNKEKVYALKCRGGLINGLIKR